MKHFVLIMRHAKSSWENPVLSDLQRPLNKRGLRDAPMMGKRISDFTIPWDTIITSPALRAMMSAQRVADAVGFHKDLRVDERLYMQGAEAMCDILKELDETIRAVMLFGHNPDMEAFYTRLGGTAIEKFPTAAFGIFETKKPWSACDGFRALWFDTPKSQR